MLGHDQGSPLGSLLFRGLLPPISKILELIALEPRLRPPGPSAPSAPFLHCPKTLWVGCMPIIRENYPIGSLHPGEPVNIAMKRNAPIRQNFPNFGYGEVVISILIMKHDHSGD